MAVATTGAYDIGLRVASGSSGGRVHLAYGGANVGASLTIPNTGGWQRWTTLWIRGVTLTAAPGAVLRLAFDATSQLGTSIANVNAIVVRRVSGTPTPTATPTPTVTAEAHGHAEAGSRLRRPIRRSTTRRRHADPDAPARRDHRLAVAGHVARSAPAPRFESTGVTVGTKIFVFGGFYDFRQYVRATTRCTTCGQPLDHARHAPAGMAETHLGAATDGRYVYLAGGLGGSVQEGKKPPQWISARVYRYDTVANTWDAAHLAPGAARRRRARADRPRAALLRRRDRRHQHRCPGTGPSTSMRRRGRCGADPGGEGITSAPWPTPARSTRCSASSATTSSSASSSPRTATAGHGHVGQARERPAGQESRGELDVHLERPHRHRRRPDRELRLTDRVAAYHVATNTWSELARLPARRQGVVVQKVGARFVITPPAASAPAHPSPTPGSGARPDGEPAGARCVVSRPFGLGGEHVAPVGAAGRRTGFVDAGRYPPRMRLIVARCEVRYSDGSRPCCRWRCGC